LRRVTVLAVVEYNRVYKSRRISHDHVSLEDEISNLRYKMEQAVTQEKSLTSELVVQLSSMLDHKINEYMKYKSRAKKN
jgi:hypothetical protein